jgi:glutamate N-acetyltransferase/amino-acid N-acetyltransferase
MEINTCRGFLAGGMAAGIKKNGAKDLGLLYSEVPAAVAGMFTRNRVKAAPVLLDQERISAGTCRAVIVNSGNANCCTGEDGMLAAQAMARLAAQALKVAQEEVLVASTGVIGEPLPVAKIESAAAPLAAALAPEGWIDLARAIMTTDTVPKLASRRGSIDGTEFTIVAVAKGAGMIRPDMATMLCFVGTDAQVSPSLLQTMLAEAVGRSFNRISIDGDTSTNDTVLILANGQSGAAIDSPARRRVFQSLLDDLLLDLARWLVKDGEGVTKLVEVRVRGAASDQDAARIVEAVAHSPLVKTAFFGEDANWGRIAGAAGRAGAELDPRRLDIFFDQVQMVQNGSGCGKAAEAQATGVLKQAEFTVTIDLHLGSGRASMLTCDFSVDYVKINANYRS